MEKQRDDGDPAAHDLNNEKFWQKLNGTFRETIEMVREDAKRGGIDLEDPKLLAEVAARERKELRAAAKNLPVACPAMAYLKTVNKWFKQAGPSFHAKGLELETLAKLEAGNPRAEAAKLAEFVEVIRWYQHFVYVKLRRAIESRASEQVERNEELKAFPKDSDGSAKIALIAMDRSIAAWSGLRAARRR